MSRAGHGSQRLVGVASAQRVGAHAGCAQLTELIRLIHQSSRHTYGAPRIHAALAATGMRCKRKRVTRLMRNADWWGVTGTSRSTRPNATRRPSEPAI